MKRYKKILSVLLLVSIVLFSGCIAKPPEKPPINKVEDLKGKTIAVPAYGSVQDVLTRMVLKEHGLDPTKDVKLMEAGELGGVSQLPTLLKRGEIDAFVAWPPFNEIPIVEGYGRALLKPSEMIPNNPCCVIAARNDFVENNPELTKKILYIVKYASIFAQAYPEEAAKSIHNVVGFNTTIAEYSLDFAGWYCILPSEESINTTMKILGDMKELGYIRQDLTKERVYNLKYTKEIHPEPVHRPGLVEPQPDIYERVTGKAPEKPKKELDTVKIGYHPAMCLAGIYVAKDQKMFEKAGIKVDIVRYEAGPPMIPAFKNKEIDIGFLGGPPAISAIDRGINVSIIGQAHTEGSAIIVRK